VKKPVYGDWYRGTGAEYFIRSMGLNVNERSVYNLTEISGLTLLEAWEGAEQGDYLAIEDRKFTKQTRRTDTPTRTLQTIISFLNKDAQHLIFSHSWSIIRAEKVKKTGWVRAECISDTPIKSVDQVKVEYEK
jgi:hypothetical protein